jgi:SAM-dependent methyltransferase
MNDTRQGHAPTDLKDQVEARYGTDYLKWKAWHEIKFGTRTRLDAKYFAAELKKTKATFALKSKVLEIGFGTGSFLTHGKEQKWEMFGTEVNNDLVERARRRGFNVFHTGDLRTFSDSIFDLIVAFDVLEHIPQDQLGDFLDEIKRVLKSGGYFIARFPNGDSPFGLINQNGDITHVTTIGSEKAKFLAARLGVEVVYLGGEAHPLSGTSLLMFSHRLVALPIRALINLLVNLMFIPRANIAFCSANLIMILKISKSAMPEIATDLNANRVNVQDSDGSSGANCK